MNDRTDSVLIVMKFHKGIADWVSLGSFVSSILR